MEWKYMRGMGIALAAALALGLAGCGGGGGGSTADAPAVTEPTEPAPAPMTYDVALPAETPMDFTAPMAGMLTVAAGGTASSGDVEFSCPAGGADCEITIADDGTASSTGGEASAALTAMAMARLETEKTMAMSVADRRAAGLAEALTRSDGVNDIFGVGAAALAITPVQIPQAGFAANTQTDIVVTRGLTGGLSVTRDRAGWNDNADQTMDAASLGAGWAGKVLTNGATQTLTVHSNIANAVRADFEADTTTSIYRLNQAAGTIPHLVGADTQTAAAGLTLTNVDMQDAYAQGLLDPGFFPGPGATGSRTQLHTYSAAAGPGPRNYAATFTGTFHGASGRYACAVATCTIAITPANLTAPATYVAVGGWTFTPDREATAGNDAQLHRQDNNWLSFGYWLNEPTAARPGGAFLYNAQVFYRGAQVFAAAPLAAGNANSLSRLNMTYTGPAAGLYARTANAATGVTSARGEFSANASLTARYGVAAGTDVSGTISNFQNGDGVDMSGWTLNLQRTAVFGGTSGAAGANAGSVTSGTATNRAGLWEYTLYGPSRPGEYPTGVAGRFFATVDANTAVAGGFGAE